MAVYLTAEGSYYSADKARSFADSTVPFPSPKLEALLGLRPDNVKGPELTELFAHEKNDPGFIMRFVETQSAPKE